MGDRLALSVYNTDAAYPLMPRSPSKIENIFSDTVLLEFFTYYVGQSKRGKLNGAIQPAIGR